jgi:hypothetical protein
MFPRIKPSQIVHVKNTHVVPWDRHSFARGELPRGLHRAINRQIIACFSRSNPKPYLPLTHRDCPNLQHPRRQGTLPEGYAGMCGHPSDQSQALNTHGTIRNCPFSNRFLTRKWNYPSCYFTLKCHGIVLDPSKSGSFSGRKIVKSMMFY